MGQRDHYQHPQEAVDLQGDIRGKYNVPEGMETFGILNIFLA
jgi:hypothetical protein